MVVRPSYAPATEKEIGLIQAQDRQNRRTNYWLQVLPFILEQTMGHRLAMVNYSKRTGFIPDPKRPSPIRNFPRSHPEAGKPILIRNKKEIQEFMDRTGRFEDAGMGAFTKGLVTFFYVATTSGLDNRFMLFDFDIIDLPETSFRPKVLKVVELLEKEGYKALPVFTGSSWHVWAKMPDDTPIGDYGGIGPPATGIVGKVVEVATKLKIDIRGVAAHVKGMVTVDYAINRANSPLRFPLSLHHKTGLVAIPLSKDEILSLDPKEDAHPEVVLANLEKYKKRIQEFYTFNKYKDGDTKASFRATVFEEQVDVLKREHFPRPINWDDMQPGDAINAKFRSGQKYFGVIIELVTRPAGSSAEFRITWGDSIERAIQNGRAAFEKGKKQDLGVWNANDWSEVVLQRKLSPEEMLTITLTAPVFEEQVAVLTRKRFPQPTPENTKAGDKLVLMTNVYWTSYSDYGWVGGTVDEVKNKGHNVWMLAGLVLTHLGIQSSSPAHPSIPGPYFQASIDGKDPLKGGNYESHGGIPYSIVRFAEEKDAPVFEEQVDFLKVTKLPRPVEWEELVPGDVFRGDYLGTVKTGDYYYGLVVERDGERFKVIFDSTKLSPVSSPIPAEQEEEIIKKLNMPRSPSEYRLEFSTQWRDMMLIRRGLEIKKAPVFEELVDATMGGSDTSKLQEEYNCIAPHVIMKGTEDHPVKLVDVYRYVKDECYPDDPPGELRKDHLELITYAIKNLAKDGFVHVGRIEGDRSKELYLQTDMKKVKEKIEEVKKEREKKKAPVFEEQVDALLVKHVHFPRPVKWEELQQGDLIEAVYFSNKKTYWGIVTGPGTPHIGADNKMIWEVQWFDKLQQARDEYDKTLTGGSTWNTDAWSDVVLIDRKLTMKAPVFEEQVSDLTVKREKRIPHVGDTVRILKTAYFDKKWYGWVEMGLEHLYGQDNEWVEKGETAEVTDVFVKHGGANVVEDLVVSVEMISWPSIRSDLPRCTSISQIPIAWVEVIKRKEAPVFEELVKEEVLPITGPPLEVAKKVRVNDLVKVLFKWHGKKDSPDNPAYGVVQEIIPVPETGDIKLSAYWGSTIQSAMKGLIDTKPSPWGFLDDERGSGLCSV